MRYLLPLFCVFLVGCTKDLVMLKDAQVVNKAVPTKCFKKVDIPPPEEWPLDAVDLSDDKTALPRIVHAAGLERDMRIKHVEAWGKILEKCAD